MFYKKIKTRDAFLHLEESTLGVEAHDCVVIKVARQGQLVDLYRPLNIYVHVILYKTFQIYNLREFRTTFLKF